MIPHHILHQTIYVTPFAVIFIIMIMDFRSFSDLPRGSVGILTHTKKHAIVKTHWLKTKTSSAHNAR